MDTKVGAQAPTVSVVLPYKKTKGEEAIELYNKTEKTALEWQESLCYDIMAVNEEDQWIHQKFGYSVPRRNGKSENVLIRCAWGLKHGERILYTAHLAATAHAVWDRLDRLCEKANIPVESRFRAFGKEHLYIRDGGEIEFRTRTSTGGLGEGYDLLIIDEAQEYTPDQETALKYVVTDSQNPQTILLGTPPTAISAGTVFPNYREAVITGNGYESGWAEWSVPEMSDVHDTELWYKTNPSLGTVLNERAIRSEIMLGDETDFNIQRLGLWLKYNQKSAISENEWDELEVTKLPKLEGKLFVGIKFGHDGINASVSVAVKTKDGKVFTEVYGCKPVREGFAWIVKFLRGSDIGSIVIDGENGKALLDDILKSERIGKPILPKVAEIIKANATFEQLLASGTICHMAQPSLRNVVGNCEKRAIGSNGGFGYKSQLDGADISLLDSVILASWQCAESKEVKKQRISY